MQCHNISPSLCLFIQSLCKYVKANSALPSAPCRLYLLKYLPFHRHLLLPLNHVISGLLTLNAIRMCKQAEDGAVCSSRACRDADKMTEGLVPRSKLNDAAAVIQNFQTVDSMHVCQTQAGKGEETT